MSIFPLGNALSFNAPNYVPYIRKKSYNILIPFYTSSATVNAVNVSSSVSSECKDRSSAALNSPFPKGGCFAYGSNFCNLEIGKCLRNFGKYLMKLSKML